MPSVNKVILLGNIGQTPDLRFTPGGVAIMNVSLATTHTWKDRDTGAKHEKTEWHRVVFFGKQAELIKEYCAKGDTLYVEGRIESRKYTDSKGVERTTVEIAAESMQMLGNRKGAGESPPPEGSLAAQVAARHGVGANAKHAADAPADEDIPF